MDETCVECFRLLMRTIINRTQLWMTKSWTWPLWRLALLSPSRGEGAPPPLPHPKLPSLLLTRCGHRWAAGRILGGVGSGGLPFPARSKAETGLLLPGGGDPMVAKGLAPEGWRRHGGAIVVLHGNAGIAGGRQRWGGVGRVHLGRVGRPTLRTMLLVQGVAAMANDLLQRGSRIYGPSLSLVRPYWDWCTSTRALWHVLPSLT
jgi:hypothetical protein